MLYIVSTPIGNLKDITFRAIETLKTVSLIAAEDTRHTRILLEHYGIKTPTTSYYDQNEKVKSQYILSLLQEGKDVALVSDAGTPGISDPGFVLIRLAQENKIPIAVIPGPSAVIAALSASGLASHAFVFEGFLPVKTGARRKKLLSFKDEERTVVFYESPHRLLKTLKDIDEVLENPVVVCARELTKKFEEVKKASVQELLQHFTTHPPKGEFVLLINNK